MNKAGRMNSAVGNRSFTAAFCANSSASMSRLVRRLSAWTRSLRSRRTDLLKLYSVEILTPAEMEKKYGKPPARLSAWPLKSGTTFVAVANLSGHAAIVLLRQAGAAWQVVGFHD